MTGPQPLTFPEQAICGSIGELAEVLTAGTEVPRQFAFAAALTALGALLSGRIRLANGVGQDCRLYTVLIGESSGVKKSTAIERVQGFFGNLSDPSFRVIVGVGSAEGLMRELKATPRVLLAFDELRAFADKIRIEGSTLLPMVSTLYERHLWENSIASGGTRVENARLSLLAACTRDGYDSLWSQEALAIGLTNRILLVHADPRPKIAWPAVLDPQRLEAVRARIARQLAAIPPSGIEYGIEPGALATWERWYYDAPRDEYSRRLDTIGFRLLALLTFVCDKASVDLETVERVTTILDYEYRARRQFDSINAGSTIARMEERVRRVLAEGPLSQRDLEKRTNARRVGLWVLTKALDNLASNGELTRCRDAQGRNFYAMLAEGAPSGLPSLADGTQVAEPQGVES